MPSSCWRPSPDRSVVQTTGSQRGPNAPPSKGLHKIRKRPQKNNKKLVATVNFECATETSMPEYKDFKFEIESQVPFPPAPPATQEATQYFSLPHIFSG